MDGQTFWGAPVVCPPYRIRASECFVEVTEVIMPELSFSQLEDPVVEKLWDSTEEGKKVTRNGGKKFCACFRRCFGRRAESNPVDVEMWMVYVEFLYSILLLFDRE